MKVHAYPSKKNKDEYLILAVSRSQKTPPAAVRNRFEAHPYKKLDTRRNPMGLDPKTPEAITKDGYYIATTKTGFSERVVPAPSLQRWSRAPGCVNKKNAPAK